MGRIALTLVGLVAAVIIMVSQAPVASAFGTARPAAHQATSLDGRTVVCAAYADMGTVKTMVLMSELGGFAIDMTGQVRISKAYRDLGGWCHTTLPPSEKCWHVFGSIAADGTLSGGRMGRALCSSD